LKPVSIILAFCFLFTFTSISAEDKSAGAISQVKKMISFIRFKKNDKAIEFIDTATFSKNLLGSHYDAASEEDRKEFESAIKEYIQKKSFPIAVKYFDKIDINYEKPVARGAGLEIPSSILYKGSERITFSWVMSEKGGKYLISDFINEGKLSSDTYRKDTIEPKIQKSGIKELISAIRKASNQ
jgi:ABC-type transporter MlaC component